MGKSKDQALGRVLEVARIQSARELAQLPGGDTAVHHFADLSVRNERFRHGAHYVARGIFSELTGMILPKWEIKPSGCGNLGMQSKSSTPYSRCESTGSIPMTKKYKTIGRSYLAHSICRKHGRYAQMFPRKHPG